MLSITDQADWKRLQAAEQQLFEAARYTLHPRRAKALNTTPGTLADDLGCFAALTTLSAVAYALLVLA
jgi:hypothetical protein